MSEPTPPTPDTSPEPGDTGTEPGPALAPVQVRDPRTDWLVQVWEADAWCAVAAPFCEADRPAAIARLHQRQQRFPDDEHRLIRRTTTYTLEEPQP